MEKEIINEKTGELGYVIPTFSDFNDLIYQIDSIKNKEGYENDKIVIKQGIEYNKQTIDKDVDFSDCIFEKKVKLYNFTFLHRAYFDNTTFKDLVDFYGCTFKKPQQFFKTDFDKVAIFSNATFEQEAQFIYCTTTSSSYISFQSTKFKKGLDIARANFNCKVSCWDIQIEDKGLNNAMQSKYYLLDFDFEWLKNEIKEYLPNLSDNDIYNSIHREDTNIEKDINDIFSPQRVPENITNEIKKLTPVPKKLRESMRFIKNNFYAENSKIEGLDFAGREQKIFLKELWRDDSKEESFLFIFIPYILISLIYYVVSFMLQAYPIWLFIYSIIHIILILIPIIITINITRHFNNLIMLLLNKLSNNFGTSWILGIIFTIIIGILCYTLILLSLQKMPLDKIDEDIYNFGQIINIAKWDIKIYGEEIKGWAYISLFIGRIFIGYGYYQTIQAFRKYGKS